MPRFLQTNPQTFNVTTVIIAFLKFFKKFYLFIKKLFFFFWPSLHFKDEETGSDLACASSELEFKCRLAPMLCSFSQTTLSKPERLAACYCYGS